MLWTVLCVFTVLSHNTINAAENAKLKDPMKANGTEAMIPGSVNSRFFDLGGMFNQMFQGFNRGNQGPGNAGYPGNSQFQPGFSNNYPQNIDSGNNWQNSAGPQNQYPYQDNLMQNQRPVQNEGMQNGYPNQGQQMNGPFQNQGQQISGPFQNQGRQMNGPFQNQGQQIIGPAQNQGGFEQPNFNQQPIQRPGNIQYPSDQEEYPNENQNNYYPDQGQGGDGTLDDIIPTNPNAGQPASRPGSMRPLNRPNEPYDQNGSSSSIRRPVVLPSSTVSPDTIYFSDSTESPAKKQCVQDCQTTSEYNPMCGSNNVTYFNPGRFVCARNCGVNVFLFKRGKCT